MLLYNNYHVRLHYIKRFSSFLFFCASRLTARKPFHRSNERVRFTSHKRRISSFNANEQTHMHTQTYTRHRNAAAVGAGAAAVDGGAGKKGLELFSRVLCVCVWMH